MSICTLVDMFTRICSAVQSCTHQRLVRVTAGVTITFLNQCAAVTISRVETPRMAVPLSLISVTEADGRLFDFL